MEGHFGADRGPPISSRTGVDPAGRAAMDDPRLNSMHLGITPRRQQYPAARDALLGARGWLTLGAEQLRGLLDAGDDSSALVPVRPEQVLAGTRFLLVDHQAGCGHVLKTGL